MGKLSLIVSSCLLVLFLMISGCATTDILVTDFEGNSYGDWKMEGEAFGRRPAKGTLPDQQEVTGYLGEGLVNTFDLEEGDELQGTLTSPSFKIERRYINFLIGGGNYPVQTCINLIIDDEVARSATGKKDEKLEWATFDVSQFQGQNGVIQILDESSEDWGHINVDHITQSDTPKAEKIIAEKPLYKHRTITKEIKISKKYVNIPVITNAPRHRIRFLLDGKIVREGVIELAQDEPDFWVVADLSEYNGKTLTIESVGRTKDDKILDSIKQADHIIDGQNIYKEKLRPQFHFTSKRGWNNDSNGMVYYDGEYHLFYQHNPYGWHWGNMTWGHAVSTDMVHWEELGDALHLDELGTIFSGSAVIDENNTAGFQTGDEKVMVCFYTSAGGTNPWSEDQPFTQSIAYSNDRGRTFTKYEKNPIIGHIRGGNRDPKVIWHEATNQWVMVLFVEESEMAFFTSDDLKSWTETSRLKSFHECPELFELPVDGDQNNKKWILYGAAGEYFVGDFDGKEFKPDGGAIRFNYGNCFYASQTFNNIPEEDGRRIQIAWGQINMRGMPFNQMMDFPVELTLHTTDEGVRMFAQPIREIEKIHKKKHCWKNETLEPGKNLLSGIEGELFDIRAEFAAGDADEFGFVIRGVPVVYNVNERQLSCQKEKASLKPVNGKISLQILVDRTSIEIFANDGRIYMPIGVHLVDNDETLEVFTKGGQTRINLLEVYELSSIWH